MKIRGVQFPAFVLKWPNKRDQTFVLKYVERDGKNFKSLLDIRVWHYASKNYSIGIPKGDKSYIGSLGGRSYRSANELPDDYKHMTIHSIFCEDNEGRIRESK